MNDAMDNVISLAKRRGFIFPSSSLYGGFSSVYDYGPLGVELKNNIKKAWWHAIVQTHEDVVGVDAAILMAPKVWEASGHLSAGFADPLVECKKCHERFRADKPEEEGGPSFVKTSEGKEEKCPSCGGKLTEPRTFNLMMKTHVGPVEDESTVTYLRAETAQGIFMNYQNVLDTARVKIPFGIAQVGKAFRNEITPGNFIYRMREFEQMEMEYFVNPKDADRFFEQWKEERMQWYLDFGVKKENLRFRDHEKDELAHYARRATDIEYNFPFGWREIEGIHDRGDWDLSNHAKHSGQDLKYEGYYPYVIETSAGADRSVLVFLLDALESVKGGRTETTESTKEEELVLKLHKRLAPIKVAVLPLVKNKSEITDKAKEVFDVLKPRFMAQYDEQGSVGRRYRRQDEIGTPFCVTVDFDTLNDDSVTVRDRDTMEQERVKIGKLTQHLLTQLRI